MTTLPDNVKSRNTHRRCLEGFARVNRISRISRHASDYDVPLSIRISEAAASSELVSKVVQIDSSSSVCSLHSTRAHARSQLPIIPVNYVSGRILRCFLRFRFQHTRAQTNTQTDRRTRACETCNRRSASLETRLKRFAGQQRSSADN